MIYAFFLQTISNYWTRLSQISWFVSGEQINHLPKPKAEANNWPARHGRITIFCDNRVQLLFYHSISKFFLTNIFGKRSDLLFFHARTIERRRKVWFRLRMSRILFAAKQSWRTLCMGRPYYFRQFFAGHIVAFGQWKGRTIGIEW